MDKSQLKDHTFRGYDSQQARIYAKERGTYPAELYNTILQHHEKTGGSFKQLLDVGCGPGNATRDISPHFTHATAVDGSIEMINTAKTLGGGAAVESIDYQVANAEEIDNVAGLHEGSVDVITAAMAAHWFNMDQFWAKAAQMLKSNGTVALWTVSSLYCHPSTPNASRVQEILFELEREILAPFELPSNRISRDMYENLGLPWTVSPKVDNFDPAQFVRVEWNRDGHVGMDEDFFMGRRLASLDDLARSLSTASMVTRWRQAHPELVGTDLDCVTSTIQKLRNALEGVESFVESGAVVLLMLKKTA